MKISDYFLSIIEWMTSYILWKFYMLWCIIWLLNHLNSNLVLFFLFFGNGFLLLLIIIRAGLYKMKQCSREDSKV